MNVLIVYSHPNHSSLNAAFLQSVIKGGTENKHINEVKVIDLYGEKFNPVLYFDEHHKRTHMQYDQRFENHRQLILWAEKIVFIYPIWWGRPPAILLGFFDQIFAKGFAYKQTKGVIAEGLLKGKSVVCISTMQGPTVYSAIWLKNAHKVLMKRAVFNFVGIRKVKFFEFSNMEKKNGNQSKYISRTYHYFKSLKK